jgi:hypothetical protein
MYRDVIVKTCTYVRKRKKNEGKKERKNVYKHDGRRGWEGGLVR